MGQQNIVTMKSLNNYMLIMFCSNTSKFKLQYPTLHLYESYFT